MESLENYFKEWASQYGQLKFTKMEVKEKMLNCCIQLTNHVWFCKEKVKSILGISKRHEQRYWIEAWRLIELLNIIHCLASILVESGLTMRYLMRETNYVQFLKSFLNNVEANHEAPKFGESLILRLVL
ncbi:13958_t:CDS:2 [Gigaspora margarita]|uniref:13958_t:CDS:1 n=1 Tax=Gigaspora margarita TaxID=4874 RepID=A0ABM8W0V7_GIGMA|nr:13958_t:CDS:2 [Gigaspora margarita]